MEVIQKCFSFWSLFENVLKASQASSLWIRNITHVNLEKSSTITRPYFLLLRLVVLVGPNRSRCKNSSDLVVDTTLLLWKELLAYLPLRQNLQVESFSKLILGKHLLVPSKKSHISISYEYDQVSYATTTFHP